MSHANARNVLIALVVLFLFVPRTARAGELDIVKIKEILISIGGDSDGTNMWNRAYEVVFENGKTGTFSAKDLAQLTGKTVDEIDDMAGGMRSLYEKLASNGTYDMMDEAAEQAYRLGSQGADDALELAQSGSTTATGTTFLGAAAGYTFSYGLPAVGLVLTNPGTAQGGEILPAPYLPVSFGRCGEILSQWLSLQRQIFQRVDGSTDLANGVGQYVDSMRQARDMLEAEFNAHCQPNQYGGYGYSDVAVSPPDVNPFIGWTQDMHRLHNY